MVAVLPSCREAVTLPSCREAVTQSEFDPLFQIIPVAPGWHRSELCAGNEKFSPNSGKAFIHADSVTGPGHQVHIINSKQLFRI